MNFTKALLHKADHISFHTPSHANKLNSALLSLDVTELPYSDNLLSPDGIIKNLQDDIAAVYNVAACFISTLGATSSIMTAIYALKNLGGFLVIGNAHVSVYNALRIFGCKAWRVDELTETTTLPEGVKTAIITTPDYFGNCLALDKVTAYLKSKNIVCLVDASHGSHFVFSDKLPVSAAEYGDLVVHSLHKTLPVLTGGSVLLLKNETFVKEVSLARKTLHSTSPSYMIMSSIDYAFSEYKIYGRVYYNKIFQAVENFKKSLPAPFTVVKNDDFSRLVISSPFDGKVIYNTLAKMGIYAEMYYENLTVFIVNNNNYKYLPKLYEALNTLSQKKLAKYKPYNYLPFSQNTPLELVFGKEYEFVEIENSENRLLFNEVGFYPPGVPIFFAGHLITKNDIDLLKKRREDCFGLEYGMLCVVK